MSVNQIPIDGLWRCLCPSFDSLVLSFAARQPATLRKPSALRRHRPSTQLHARAFRTTTTARKEETTPGNRTFKLTSAPAGQHIDVVRFTPQEASAGSQQAAPKPLFPGLAENRKHVQNERAERKVAHRLFGSDVDGWAATSKEGFRLGDWGDVPNGIGSVSLRLGKEHGAIASAPLKQPTKGGEQKREKKATAQRSEPHFVELGPAKWGAMSFQKQSGPAEAVMRDTGQPDQQSELEGYGTSVASWRPLPAAKQAMDDGKPPKETAARIMAAYEVYQKKMAGVAKQGSKAGSLQEAWNAEDVSVLHDKLRAYRMEEGQFDRVVELVEYLLGNRGDKPTLIHYDSLVRANADAEKGSAECVRILLEEMKEEGIKGDSGFYHAVLQALAIHPDYALRAEVMQEMKERWFGLSPEGWHSLVVGLLRDRQLEMALDRLEEMHTDGILVQPWLYDIFTYILCENGEHDEAFHIMMHRYEQARFGISLSHWQYLLDTFSQASHYEATKQVWDTRVQAADLIPSDGTCAAVLNVAARHADPALATSVIQVLSARGTSLTVSHYEALLEAYIGIQDINTAFRVLAIMEKAGLNPTSASTRPLFTHLAKSPESCHAAWETLITLREEGHTIPITAVNVLLESLSSQNQIEQTFTYYKRLHEICPRGPNTETINVVLQGLQRNPTTSSSPSLSTSTSPPPSPSPSHTQSQSTPKSKAMFLASEMRALKIKPDALTYDRLIRICLLDETDYEDAFRYLEEMEEVGRESVQRWWMRAGTANRMVLVCAKRGDSRAREIMREMERRGMVVRGSVRGFVERFEGEREREKREGRE